MIQIANYMKTPKNERFFTVAIDGRGGAGKTAFTDYLKTLLPDFTYLYYDDYFEPTPDGELWGAFNEPRFIRDVVDPLKRSNRLVYQPYNWHAKPHITKRPVMIDKGVCIEGCFSFSFAVDWDIKIWIETPREVSQERGVERDAKNMEYEKALHAWRDIWLPPEDEYIKKIKPLETADLVIDGTKPFDSQLS